MGLAGHAEVAALRAMVAGIEVNAAASTAIRAQFNLGRNNPVSSWFA